jgi:hypothetical protein
MSQRKPLVPPPKRKKVSKDDEDTRQSPPGLGDVEVDFGEKTFARGLKAVTEALEAVGRAHGAADKKGEAVKKRR